MKFIFVTLINFMITLANAFLLPVNTLVSNVFPTFSSYITSFTTLITTYFGTGLSYFFGILPPNFRTFALFYLSILLICYTVTLSLHLILKIIAIIKNIKIW